MTSSEFNSMIQNKKRLNPEYANIANERLELQARLETARARNDVTDVLETTMALEMVEQLAKSQALGNRDAKMERIAAMNLKNRDINFREGRQAEKAAHEKKKMNDIDGIDDYDPFARRKADSRYVSDKVKQEVKLGTVSPKALMNKSIISSPPKRLPRSKSPELDLDAFLDSIDVTELAADL